MHTLINEFEAIREKGAKAQTGQLGKHLVFSSFTAFFDVLAPALRERRFKVSLFTGKTSAQDREEAIRPFQNDRNGGGQGIDRGLRGIELPPTMIGHIDSIRACLLDLDSVFA